MKYDCYIDAEMVSRVRKKYELDPKDYIDCEDEDELYDVIEDSLRERFSNGNSNYYDIDFDPIDLSDEFIYEWEQLKKQENETFTK